LFAENCGQNIEIEYGVANLYDKSMRQRAQQLMNIANPDFRLNLGRQAKEMHYL
jgi:4-hydroxybutyrate CoA-transferase